jgi:hypothetical protein
MSFVVVSIEVATMPCYDSSKDEEALQNKQKIVWLKNRLDIATNLLCGVMKCVESGSKIRITPELGMWWELHKLDDQAREQSESNSNT